MTPHAALCVKIANLLKAKGRYFVRPVQTGFGRKGIPDFLVCEADGSFMAIEAKVPPDKLSPWQRRELQAIVDAGGTAYVVNGVKDGALEIAEYGLPPFVK